MAYEIIILLIIFVGIGGLIGWYLSTKTKILDKFNKKSKERIGIINDPRKLKEKLDSGGPFYETGANGEKGRRIFYEVEEIDGKEQLVMKYASLPKSKEITPKTLQNIEKPKEVKKKKGLKRSKN